MRKLQRAWNVRVSCWCRLARGGRGRRGGRGGRLVPPLFLAALVVDNDSGSLAGAGFTGDDVPRVTFPSGVVRPKMLRIMAGLVQKDSCSGMARLVLLVILHLALFLLYVASFLGDDFRNGFWKNFTRRSSSWLSPYSAQCLVRHWIHAVWYVAMCVSTAPVAEPIVMSFTVPWIGCTIVATANVVTSSSSADCPDCCRTVYVVMSCGGGFFTPGAAYDSVWDSVKPMTGTFFNYFQYQEFVGCVCMLNYWFSSNDDICPDNYNNSRFKLKDKCRSEKWDVYLCGDMTIKVERAHVQFLVSGDMPVVVTTGHGVQTCSKLRRSPQLQLLA